MKVFSYNIVQREKGRFVVEYKNTARSELETVNKTFRTLKKADEWCNTNLEITMNENIDLALILDGCPKGTKLYSPIFGEVSFVEIKKGGIPRIVVHVKNWGDECFLENGQYYGGADDVEMLLFPSKDQRDWNKFERFWEKKKVKRFDPRTIKPFDKVLGLHKQSGIWFNDFYSFRNEEGISTVGNGQYYAVIPYNEDTKHLLGTTIAAPEYYRYWEE